MKFKVGDLTDKGIIERIDLSGNILIKDQGIWQASELKLLPKKRGRKFDKKKPMWHLLWTPAVKQLVDVLTYGAGKYEPDNWKKVSGLRNRYYSALMRHINAWWEGERNDQESGLHHLAHAMCNLMFLMWNDEEVSS